MTKFHVRAFNVKGQEILGNCDYQTILKCVQYRRTHLYKELKKGLRSATVYKWQIDNYEGTHNYETIVNSQYTGMLNEETPPETTDCMAVWEFYVENSQYMEMLPEVGACERREWVVKVVTPLCDKWYKEAKGLGYGAPYDWEFVPVFLQHLHILDMPTDVQIMALVQDIASGIKK